MFNHFIPGRSGFRLSVTGLMALLLLVVWSSPALPYDLGLQSFNNGVIGGQGGAFRVDSTLGQHLAGELGGVSYRVGVGFWRIVHYSSLGGISDAPPEILPTQLMQNAPNPFNPSTTIRFVVGQAGRVDLRLYDLQGRLIAVLVSEDMEAGPKELQFEPRGLPSGIYLYRLKTVDATEARRMTLLK